MRIVLALLMCWGVAFAQDTTKYFKSVDYGWNWQRGKFRGGLILPTDTTNNKLGIAQIGATCFAWSGTKWSSIGSTDTSFLVRYYRKNQVDSAILANTPAEFDTTSLSNRINTKLNITDTTNKWVASVSSLNDSTIRVIKGTTTTDITIKSSATVTNATRLITTVYNNSGSTITKGSVVYINGAHSSILPSIALAKANTESTSAYTYGLVENDITNNNSGTVIQNGFITNLNLPTSTYTAGQTLYLSPTVAGGYTLTKPLAPNHYVAIGTITRAHPTFGTIQIAIRNGFQLDEMSDVSIAVVPQDSTLLQFSRTDSLWHDVSVFNAIGNKYLKPTDTASLSTRINTKLNASDTASLSTRINTKLNTTTAASTYLPLTGGTLSSRLTGTSLIINKDSLPNVTGKTWGLIVDTSNSNRISRQILPTSIDSPWRAWTDTLFWTATTAPSGTANNYYRWSQNGKVVTLEIRLNYASTGSNITQIRTSLPAEMPLPSIPTNWSTPSTGDILYYKIGNYNTSLTGVGFSLFCSIILGDGASSRRNKIQMNMATTTASKYIYTMQYLIN